MFYKFINQPKLELLKLIFNIFLITSYMTTISSCMTTDLSYVSPDSIESVEDGKILKIELKDGTLVNCKNKLIKIEKGADSVNYFVINSKVNNKDIKPNPDVKRISEKDIYKIYLEKSEVNVPLTIMVVSVAVAMVIVAATTSVFRYKY